MIRAEISKQWSALLTEQQHGATQADAQHAILAYQHHEDSSFQMFVNKGGRLVPKHDSTTIQLMSISIDKYQGNKRKEIALNWDIKYTIYTGVKENFNAFLNNASGSGQERWKQAIGYVFLPSDPNCYWNCNRAVCRCASAKEGWEKYKNETAYNCQIASCPTETGFANVPLLKQCDPKWGQNDYDCPTNQIGKTICSSGCGITSAAMVLQFYGKDVSPAKMASESLAHGDRPCGGGTAQSFFPYIAQKYGLKYKEVKNPEEAMQLLKKGKPIIAGTSLTGSGHYVVLTGINAEGLVMINDPMANGLTSATQTKIRNVWKHGHLIEP